jgi:hypothetical protein
VTVWLGANRPAPRPGHFGPARARPSMALIVPGPAQSTHSAVLGPGRKPAGLLRQGARPGWPVVHRHGPGTACLARLSLSLSDSDPPAPPVAQSASPTPPDPDSSSPHDLVPSPTPNPNPTAPPPLPAAAVQPGSHAPRRRHPSKTKLKHQRHGGGHESPLRRAPAALRGAATSSVGRPQPLRHTARRRPPGFEHHVRRSYAMVPHHPDPTRRPEALRRADTSCRPHPHLDHTLNSSSTACHGRIRLRFRLHQ